MNGLFFEYALVDTYLICAVFSRLAPEVLLSGQYGKENDIFMLGTVIWQFFRIRELAERDPLASHRDFAPCANTAKDQVTLHNRFLACFVQKFF